ncbi:MAG: ABC transporter permease [Acidiferrobacteraceae bacterium]
MSVPMVLPFKLVILDTDFLLYALFAVLIVLITRVRRNASLRQTWRRVFERPGAMAAVVVLAVYAAIALLDSVHFRTALYAPDGAVTSYSPQILSVLDILCGPLRLHTEHTYSAPFAEHALVRETVMLPGGRVQRIFPRLIWGGRGLAGRLARTRDILQRSGRGLVEALLVWLMLLGGVWLVREGGRDPRPAWKRLWRGDGKLPWRTFWLTTGLMLLIGTVVANLAVEYHVLGTDQVGIDVLYKSLKSIRTGVVIGTVATLVALPFAIVLGIAAGYFGGFVDDAIQYLYTTLSSIPGVLLIAAAVLSLDLYLGQHAREFQSVLERADLRLLFLCLILGITSWTTLCRLLRGETLKLREAEFVQAAVALGESRARILRRHILPNVMHIVLITLVLDFSGLVLSEAVLTYVGVGVDPSTYSWGNMINGARLELAREPVVWWNLGAAFIFMFILVLAANLFADAVRDAFDPRFHRSS